MAGVRATVRFRTHPILTGLHRLLLYGLLILSGMIVTLPFLWLVSTSLRTYPQVLRDPAVFWPESFYFGNWPDALSRFPFLLYLRNTLIITLTGVVGMLLSSTVVAYGFVRFRTWWLRALFPIVLATMMVPAQITTIPLYIWYVRLGWIDTFLPLTVPTFFCNAFAIFLLRQFFRSLPAELADAAVIDGASEFMILRRIYVPLSTAPLAALTVLHFLGNWNDLYGPSLFLQSQERFTLQQGLLYLISTTAAGSGQNSTYGAPWNLMAAAASLTTLPIILIFFAAQRYFIEGIALSVLKG